MPEISPLAFLLLDLPASTFIAGAAASYATAILRISRRKHAMGRRSRDAGRRHAKSANIIRRRLHMKNASCLRHFLPRQSASKLDTRCCASHQAAYNYDVSMKILRNIAHYHSTICLAGAKCLANAHQWAAPKILTRFSARHRLHQ